MAKKSATRNTSYGENEQTPIDIVGSQSLYQSLLTQFEGLGGTTSENEGLLQKIALVFSALSDSQCAEAEGNCILKVANVQTSGDAVLAQLGATSSTAEAAETAASQAQGTADGAAAAASAAQTTADNAASAASAAQASADAAAQTATAAAEDARSALTAVGAVSDRLDVLEPVVTSTVKDVKCIKCTPVVAGRI